MPDYPSRSRRHHSAAFKAKVLAACAQPGASVASVALVHGVNANLVHRWRRADAKGGRTRLCKTELAEFVPMTIASPPVVAATEDIRIELRRGACAVSIAWPTSAATACAGWLRELLR
ncbi:MAG: transposase [Gammaproteobacteria bacterium]